MTKHPFAGEAVAQWREEAEAAMAAGEWSVAKMAVARWLSVAPNDPDAQEAQTEVEKQLESLPAEEENTTEEEAVEDTIACLACGHENRPDAQYCRACGYSLEVQPESSPIIGANDKAKALHWPFVLWWILATVVGSAVGGAMGGAVASVTGVVVGAVVGVSQWWILKSHIRRAGWWILANAEGWAVGGAVVLVAIGLGVGIVTSPVLFWLLRNHKIPPPE
jgi:ribosomal protein L40E